MLDGCDMAVIVEHIGALPGVIARCGATLDAEGSRLAYDYDIRADRTGIARLLAACAEAGVAVRDLSTAETSLEEVFLRLVEENA